MAKATLPTNYQDDVLKSTMGGKRRYTMTDNSDGTKTLEDATQYEKVGSNFGAADINKTNTAVNAAADASKIIDNVNDIKANTQAGYMMGALAGKQLISDLGGYKFGKTTDGKPGYIVPGGADTVLPFSQGIKLVYNNSSYASSYTFGEEGDYIVSSCVCKEGWNEKGDPVITLNVASIYANYQKTIYTGNNVETAVCFSYVHAKIGNTCTTTITGIDDTRHGYLTILKVG